MAVKKRSEGQTSVSVSMETDLLAAIDERAESLGFSRSNYLATLAKKDIKEGGALVITPREKAVEQVKEMIGEDHHAGIQRLNEQAKKMDVPAKPKAVRYAKGKRPRYTAD